MPKSTEKPHADMVLADPRTSAEMPKSESSTHLRFRQPTRVSGAQQHDRRVPKSRLSVFDRDAAAKLRSEAPVDMSTQSLNASLLRVSVLHILRAAGFHSTKPSVLDALVNITERYLLLLANTTATHALANHNSTAPTLTDVRLALTDCGIFGATASAAEEEWTEKMRRSYEDWTEQPYGERRREKILQSQQEEDTRDVREFVDWVRGDRAREIRRVAGMLGEKGDAVVGPGGGASAGINGAGVSMGLGMGEQNREDWLAALKKKHSKTGEEARYAGTVLGRPAEDRDVKIEGGSAETVRDWCERVLETELKTAQRQPNGDSRDESMMDAPS